MQSKIPVGRELTDVLMSLADVMRTEFKSSAGKDAPTLTQFRALYMIKEGVIHTSKLGAVFGISQPAASKLVNSLVKDGLVKRFPDPKDRRQIELKLTPKAHASFELMYRRSHSRIDDLLVTVSESKLKTLVKLLQEVKPLLAFGGTPEKDLKS